MQIVIKITDTLYEGILKVNNKTGGYWDKSFDGVLCRAISNGTPLPKGHGRLIDADKLRAEYTKPHLVGYDEIIEDIDRQPTVVESEDEE